MNREVGVIACCHHINTLTPFFFKNPCSRVQVSKNQSGLSVLVKSVVL